MAPRREHVRTNVISTQVKSHDEKSILVEAGSFTPIRWFLEHGSQTDEDDQPLKKRRRIDGNDDDNNYQRESNIPSKDTGNILLFELCVDLCFQDTLITTFETHRDSTLFNELDFDNTSILPVVPLKAETDGIGTRLLLTLPRSKAPVLLVECAMISDVVLDLLRMVALPAQIEAFARSRWNKEYPASSVSCSLTRSTESPHTVVRLKASLSWKSGISAFPAGAPVGAARFYPDYEFLTQAYRNYAREEVEHNKPFKPQDFYESLYAPPSDLEVSGSIDSPLESELYPFQKRAVVWMMRREGVELKDGQIQLVPEHVRQTEDLSFYEPVKDVNEQTCYINFLQGQLSRLPPPDGVGILSGGLLAEEMGLGKTVELMALVMMHRRSTVDLKPILEDISATGTITSKATLIIAPSSILEQWQSELGRHAPSLKVYHYEGVPAGHRNSKSEQALLYELAREHDVVLTTYQVLAKEVHFAEEPPERNMRHARKFERKRSPLVQIQWWRVCLDEAQMVESGVTAAARVACRLPRIHSWAVSGTPLRKNVQDLHGLLIFLRYKPLSDNSKLWGHLITNHRHLFRRIFGQIALRHTKTQIRDELRLPPQKRVVVTVPFSIIEQQNYATLFENMCEEIGLNMDGSPLTDDWDPENPSTIESMRNWLVRLRQTCLHPQIGARNRRALGRGQGPLRTVAQVLEVMIDQNETNVRVEERAFLTSSLLRAHILGNNREDEHRSEKALEIYQASMETSESLLKDARDRLATAKAIEAEKGDPTAETDTEDSSSESSPLLGRLRHSLRTTLHFHHVCTFFTATAFFQIKSNDNLTEPDSERFKQLESQETSLYESAKLLRREILKDTFRKAESLMRKISSLEKTGVLTSMPAIGDLNNLGGIESRRILDKADNLFEVIREQTEVIVEWRAKMAEFLLKPLVDEDEGIETTGDEYEDSTKQQDELYVYFDAFKAMQADMNTFIAGEDAPLIDHEVKMAIRDAKWSLNPDIAPENKPMVHAPELALRLFAIRNKFRARKDRIGSVRGLIQEARTLEGSLQWNDEASRAASERRIVQRHVAALQSVFTSYTKVLNGLEKEVNLFRSTQNQRVEFYRQLQELSDAVAPYKEELDQQLDTNALQAVVRKEEQQQKLLSQLKTKQRFLLHLRDETGDQSGPRTCVICQSLFERGVLTVCGHQYCKECIQHWFQQSKTCPVCKRKLTNVDIHDITYKPQELRAQEEVHTGEPSTSQSSAFASHPIESSIYSDVDSKLMDDIKSIDLPTSYGTKIDTLGRHLHWIRENDPGAKSIVFSQYREFLDVLGTALNEFKIGYARLGRSGAAEKFRHDASVDCLLLDAKTDSSGLTLVNATHVFICEPLIQTAVELQAIARVHRIGQTRPTTVWMYLINDTVEEAIYELSVARRLAHVQSREQSRRSEKSRSATPAPLQENAIEAANSEELQSAPLTKLLVAGKGGGELVGNGDLWQCLFGKAQKSVPKVNAEAEVEVRRHLRAEAAIRRREA